MNQEHDPKFEQLKSRLQQNPDSLIFARVAEGFLTRGQVEEALQICEEGIRKHPSYVTGHMILGKCYLQKKMFDLAEKEFKRVILHDPKYLAAHKYYGDLMREVGWDNTCEMSYRKILSIDPFDSAVRETLETLERVKPKEQEIVSAGGPITGPDDVSDMNLLAADETSSGSTEAINLEDDLFSEIVNEDAPAMEENKQEEKEQEDEKEITSILEDIFDDEKDEEPVAEAPGVIDSLNIKISQRPAVSDTEQGRVEDMDLFEDAPNQGADEERMRSQHSSKNPGELLDKLDEDNLDFGTIEPAEPEEEQLEATADDLFTMTQTAHQETHSGLEDDIFASLDDLEIPDVEDLTEEIMAQPQGKKAEMPKDDPPPAPVEMKSQIDERQEAPPEIFDMSKAEPSKSLDEDSTMTDGLMSSTEEDADPFMETEFDDMGIESPQNIDFSSDTNPHEDREQQTAVKQQESVKQTEREKIVTPTLGEIYAAQGQYAKAINVFEVLLKSDPANAVYLEKLNYLTRRKEENQNA